MTMHASSSTQLQNLLCEAQVCLDNQQFAAAGDLFLQALELASDDPDLCFSTGNALRRTGDYGQAAALYRRAVDKRPGFFAALCNLGAALKELQRFGEAIVWLEKAAALQPETVELRLQLADLYIRQSRLTEAHSALEEALKRRPGSADILNGLGNCAMARRDLNAAKEYYHRALRLRPDFGEVHYNLGTLLREWDRLDEAVACYRNAIRFQPGRAVQLVNLGETYQLLGDTELSETCFRDALAIDPECELAHHNLLVSMNYNVRHQPHSVIEAHDQWGKRHAVMPLTYNWHNDRSPDRRLKIGYLSPDFCNHPAAAFLEPILHHHDRERFEIHCYAHTVHQDGRTELFRQLASHWQPVERLNDRDVTDLIRGDGIDLLIDTAGHLNGNRLGVFTRKAAPLQISGIGYPGTTGCGTIDYKITDAVIDPPQERSFTIEKPLLIRNGFCCYKPPDSLPPVEALPALTKGYFTFGSLHTTARLNESVIALWSRVLSALPSSRLIICRNTLTPSVVNRLSAWFSREGIALARIDFRNVLPEAGYLAVYNDIDISLDTHPWSGHTTACESLFMGVPIITLHGDRPAGRMVGSVLTMAGLPEFVAHSTDEFVAIAARSAASHADCADLRAGLRSRMAGSHLCDGPAYVRNLEERYREIWREWCTTR